ncbi:MAG: hypothetical protein M3Z37_09175 [Candidatus Eremiobacteraeota bacterium]|nr:hypothetical protein [Candidatus Eremiobacteraeota bacterium]
MTTSFMKNIIPAVLALALLAVVTLCGLGGSVPAPAAAAAGTDNASVAAIVGRVLHRNPGLNSYAAHARLDVKQVNFPYLHPVLEGMQYYSSPGFTVFDFPHTPGYLKGITKVESAAYSANRWQRCYDISLADKGDQYVLHMVPKIRGEVSDVYVTVAKSGAALSQVDWYYHNPGDHIVLTQTYSTINGYSVVTAQRSEIALHHIRAKGSSSFYGFAYNLPVPTPTPTPSDPLHQCDN